MAPSENISTRLPSKKVIVTQRIACILVVVSTCLISNEFRTTLSTHRPARCLVLRHALYATVDLRAFSLRHLPSSGILSRSWVILLGFKASIRVALICNSAVHDHANFAGGPYTLVGLSGTSHGTPIVSYLARLVCSLSIERVNDHVVLKCRDARKCSCCIRHHCSLHRQKARLPGEQSTPNCHGQAFMRHCAVP
eukprot:6199160-Pleurochrysis_carterae.AAC.4